jgi:hypothetical protein
VSIVYERTWLICLLPARPHPRELTVYYVIYLSKGRPLPQLKWLKGRGDVIDSSFELLPDGTVRNDLRIPGLQRTDVNTAFTCQAFNSDITMPTYHVVRLDMNCESVFVFLPLSLIRISSGQSTAFTVVSTNFRTPPLQWKKNSIIICSQQTFLSTVNK